MGPSEIINLEDLAYARVLDNSGGMKFTELVFVLTADAIKKGAPTAIIEDLPEQIESAIRRSTRLKVLDYSFPTLNRKKMFIYIP